jgi:UDP-3-O-[3-hydroxymyristoyl] N-acetylglucosamine deacetylase
MLFIVFWFKTDIIKIEGVGLHTGKNVHLKIKPAQPNTGIIFKRIDLKKNNYVIPGVYNVSSALYCTTISNDDGVSVSTIEHLMGALFGKGVDNAIIEIDSEELPILDGSAKIFVEEIERGGSNTKRSESTRQNSSHPSISRMPSSA